MGKGEGERRSGDRPPHPHTLSEDSEMKIPVYDGLIDDTRYKELADECAIRAFYAINKTMPKDAEQAHAWVKHIMTHEKEIA